MEKLASIQSLIAEYTDKFIAFLPTLIGSLVLLIVGWWVIKLITKKLKHLFEKRDYDRALRGFLLSLISITLKVLLIIIVVSQLGVKTTSLIALLGAMGLAIGLALQGSLANFAGGVIILVLKPFRLDDWIDAQGVSGSVTEISLFYTKITTFGNQLAIVPNGQMANGNVINYSVLGRRRDALTFRISYNNDIQKAREILMDIMTEQEGILKDPAPVVVMGSLEPDSVNISARFWANNDVFWDCHWHTLEQAKSRLAEAGIEIPYPQRSLHILNDTDENNQIAADK